MQTEVKPKIAAMRAAMLKDYAEGTKAQKKKLKMWWEVFRFIKRSWDSDVLLEQKDICRGCPLLGCHEIFEARLPYSKKQESSKRKVRDLIEDLIKKYHAPILSTPAVKSPDADQAPPAGYWIARSQRDVDIYISWKRRTTKAMCNSMIETYDAQCFTWGRGLNEFKHVKTALEGMPTENRKQEADEEETRVRL